MQQPACNARLRSAAAGRGQNAALRQLPKQRPWRKFFPAGGGHACSPNRAAQLQRPCDSTPRGGISCRAAARAALTVPENTDETLILLERLQRNALETGTAHGMNLVVTAGGVASSLVAFLVHSAFEGRCAAVFVKLPGTTEADATRTSYLASFIGIELWELPAEERSASDSINASAWSVPRLSGTLAAVRSMLADRGDMPAVVFDGLHAEDLPPSVNAQHGTDEAEGWDGSEDFGEAPGVSYAMVTEAADRDVDMVAPLAGLPAARRVSLLAGVPEIAMRMVADVAGMPNWDWVPQERPQLAHNGHDPPVNVEKAAAVNQEEHGFALAEAESVVVQLLRLGPHDRLRIRIGRSAEATLELEGGKLSAAQSMEAQLAARLAELGLQPLTIRESLQ